MFSKKELKDLAIAIIVLALIFSSFKIETFPITLFVIVIVFASHEIIGHKFIAQRYGADAEFKVWPLGLILGLITALLPGNFVFAAPGAVYVSPHIKKHFAFRVSYLTKKQYGIISLGGPVVNITFGIFFKMLNIFYPFNLFLQITQISFFLAVFNLIPIFPLDGSKVFTWNKIIWLLTFLISLIGLYF